MRRADTTRRSRNLRGPATSRHLHPICVLAALGISCASASATEIPSEIIVTGAGRAAVNGCYRRRTNSIGMLPQAWCVEITKRKRLARCSTAREAREVETVMKRLWSAKTCGWPWFENNKGCYLRWENVTGKEWHFYADGDIGAPCYKARGDFVMGQEVKYFPRPPTTGWVASGQDKISRILIKDKLFFVHRARHPDPPTLTLRSVRAKPCEVEGCKAGMLVKAIRRAKKDGLTLYKKQAEDELARIRNTPKCQKCKCEGTGEYDVGIMISFLPYNEQRRFNFIERSPYSNITFTSETDSGKIDNIPIFKNARAMFETNLKEHKELKDTGLACTKCGGAGEVKGRLWGKNRCNECGGTGRRKDPVWLNVRKKFIDNCVSAMMAKFKKSPVSGWDYNAKTFWDGSTTWISNEIKKARQ